MLCYARADVLESVYLALQHICKRMLADVSTCCKAGHGMAPARLRPTGCSFANCRTVFLALIKPDQSSSPTRRIEFYMNSMELRQRCASEGIAVYTHSTSVSSLILSYRRVSI